jgi:O-antigen/teichoic acid export membrane protein
MSVEDQTGQEHLGRRAAAGVLWLAAQKWAIRVSGFATLIVLTRHISPTEFGIVAAAMTVIPTIYLL